MGTLVEKSFELEFRDKARELILNFQDMLMQHPDAVFGDSKLCPLKHSFADGQYVREIFLPKGVAIVGKIHKHSHPNFLLKGKVSVFTEHEGVKHLEAPLSMISLAGTKRVVFAHEDTVWITVHSNPTNTHDLVELEKNIISPTFIDFNNHKKIELKHKTNYVIYKIQNKINSKIYIGSSKSIRNRWKQHKWMLKRNKHYNKKLQNAWNKYGEKNFEFSILETVSNEEDLKKKEQVFLSLVKPEYNLCKIAYRTTGYKHTAKWKEENSKRMIGNKHTSGKKRIQTEATRKKISESLKGKRHSDESYKKAAEKKKGMIPWNKGIPMTKEAKIKSSISHKRYYQQLVGGGK